MGLYYLPSALGQTTNFKLSLKAPHVSPSSSAHVFYHSMNKGGKVSPDYALTIFPNSNATLSTKPSPNSETKQVTPNSVSIVLCLSLWYSICDAFLLIMHFSPQISYLSLEGSGQDLTLWLRYQSNQQSFLKLINRLLSISHIFNALNEHQPSGRHSAKS